MAILGAVTDKIRQEIDHLHVADIAPGMAQAAIRLATCMDDQDGLTGLANATQALRALMLDLHKLAPVQSEGDSVDDIARDRAERRAQLRAVPASGE